MYQNELSRQARLIVLGQQAYLADLASFRARCKAWIIARLVRFQV